MTNAERQRRWRALHNSDPRTPEKKRANFIEDAAASLVLSMGRTPSTGQLMLVRRCGALLWELEKFGRRIVLGEELSAVEAQLRANDETSLRQHLKALHIGDPDRSKLGVAPKRTWTEALAEVSQSDGSGE